MILQRNPATNPLADPARLALEQAQQALRSGDPVDAERTLRGALLRSPTSVDLLALLSDLVAQRGDPAEAIVLLKRAVGLAPTAGQLRQALASHLYSSGEFRAALAEVEALPPSHRNSYAALAIEAAAFGQLGQHEPQIAIYRAMTVDHPDDAVLWMSLSNPLKAIGESDGAITALRRGIKARPTYGEAYWSLANLKSFRFDDRDLRAMRQALKGKVAAEDAFHLHFSLGKALEERDEFADSFRHYAEGNRIRAAVLGATDGSVAGRVNAAIAAFTPDLHARHGGAGDPSPDPIFVVGLQRSGSTLVEQILASHPLIEGTSELMIIENLWTRVGKMGDRSGDPAAEIGKLTEAELTALGAEYLERARAYRTTDRPYFVDKLPGNWLNVGFIKLILPNAKIVDARRHPMACGFSNFRQHYATGVAFSYSLDWIGHFYADYVRLMRHFDRVLPGWIHRIVNEQLIDDPEGETRRLIDFIGVPFDEATLSAHATKRAVRTPSAEQVRRPINRDGVDYWRRYEPWLGPLKAALGDTLDHWDD